MVEPGDEEALCSENEPISATLDSACRSIHPQTFFLNLLTFTRYALFLRLSLHIKDDFNATV